MSATPTEPEAALMLSVPAVALALGVCLDRLRRAIRERPAIAAFFTSVGPTRAMPSEWLPTLRSALAETPTAPQS